jgi:hypothetical protein
VKAIVSNHAIIEEDEPFFPLSVRQRLGKSLEVPSAGIRMWISAFQGEALHSTKSSPYVLSGTGPLKGLQFFGYTYVVGQLVLQLCASRWKNVHHRGRPILMLRRVPYWDDAAIQFWPSDGSNIIWPPSK